MSSFKLISFFVVIFQVNGYAQVISSAKRVDWTSPGYQGTKPVYSSVKNIVNYGGSGDGTTPNDLHFKTPAQL